MKSKKKQRLLALILSMVLMLSASISALAQGDVQTEASGTETTENQAAAQSLEGETVPETEASAEEAGIATQSAEITEEAAEQETADQNTAEQGTTEQNTAEQEIQTQENPEASAQSQEAPGEAAETVQDGTSAAADNSQENTSAAETAPESEVQNTETQNTETQEEASVSEEQPAETTEETVTEETVVSEATELKQEFTDEDGNVTQTVTAYVPEGAFQAAKDQISMEVKLLNEEDANYIKGMMEEKLPEGFYLDGYVLYQIDFKVNGEITRPAKAITISMTGNELAVEDTKNAHVFYYVPEDPEVEGDEDQLTEVTQKDQLIKSLEESGQSTENIEDYDYSEIAVNEGNADSITVKGWESTIYGCYVEKESVTELNYEDDSVTITVSADKAGIIPKDAELSVTPIVKTEITTDMTAEEKEEAEKINDQYELTEKKLTEDSEKNEETMEGFLAYDICFVVNGEEVEPTGDVKVTMDFKKAAIPEGVSEDAEVTVKHLKEDETAEDGVVVEDMATKASVQTTENAEVEKVELTAESFSVFTIKWTYGYGHYSDYFTIKAHYVYEENGKYINIPDEDIPEHRNPWGETLDSSKLKIDLTDSEYQLEIPGYSYLKTTVDNEKGTEISSLTKGSSDGVFGSKTYYIDHDKNKRDHWLSTSIFSSTEGDIYFIYEKDGSSGGGSTGGGSSATGNLAHRKYVEYNNDGTYDLTLNVTGAVGTETDPAEVDVVLVLDTSGSMAEWNVSTNNQNIEDAKTAIDTLITTLANNNTVESRWKLVTFASGANITNNNRWENASQMRTRISRFDEDNCDGGTNYEAAFTKAASAIGNPSEDRIQIVVFLTDGQPTYHGENESGGSAYTIQKDYDGALEGARKITCDRFYAIGMNLPDNVGYYEGDLLYPSGQYGINMSGKELLDDVAEEVNTSNRFVQNVDENGDLSQVFAGIAGDVINYTATNVHITDTLTEKVDQVPDSKPIVEVTNKNGKDVTAEEVLEGNIRASYNPDTKELKLDFDEDYELKQSYTYSVTMQIQPNEKAEQAYINNDYKYPDKGEADTGVTSENKLGIFSNVKNSAKVTWETNGEKKEGLYNRPVVQLQTPPVEVKKEPVNFFLNLSSQILDTSGKIEGQDKGNFTTSVSGNLSEGITDQGIGVPINEDLEVIVPDDHDHANLPYGDDGQQVLGVIGGTSDSNAVEVDNLIRQLGKQGGTTGNQGNQSRYTYQIVDGNGNPAFPKDEDIFEYIRENWNEVDGKGVNKGQDIEVNGQPIDKNKLTTQNFTIRWYVFKDQNDYWHIDGILVPKSGVLNITKTFESQEIADLVISKGFSINVTGDFLGDSDTTINLKITNETTRTQNRDDSITYSWSLAVFGDKYRVEEENYTLDKSSTWEYSGTEYTYTNVDGDKETGKTTSAEIQTESQSQDEEPESQTLAFKNYYTNFPVLTLTKVFDGLSDAEVNYLIFGMDDGFGWDINYCNETTHVVKDEEGDLQGWSFMEEKDRIPDGFELPDGKPVNEGGDFRITAEQFLEVGGNSISDISKIQGDSYTNEQTGARLYKNEAGNWVYSISMEVPATDKDQFYTVFEQHQEVPGYAKINDSSAEWTITKNGVETKGTGKYIDETDNNIYESMSEIYQDSNEYDGIKYNEKEDVCIAAGAFKRIKINEATTITFTNHYKGDLELTKAIGEDNQYSDAMNKEYKITIQPADLDKLTLGSTDLHGLKGKTFNYTIENAEDQSVEEIAVLDKDGAFKIILKPGEIAHFTDMPAIQWQATENAESNAVEGYSLDITYSDENKGVLKDATHWNEYENNDIIGVTKDNDGIASVDNAVRDNHKNPQVDADAVALIKVTNTYKSITGNLILTKEVVGTEVTDKNYSFTISTENGLVAGQSYIINGSETKVTFSETPVDGKYTATVTVSTTTVESGVDGSITINGLPIGTYTVMENTENAAIDGYQLVSTDYKVGQNETSQIELTAGVTGQMDVTNTYGKEWQMVKISSSTSDTGQKLYLGGAEFTAVERETNKKYTGSSAESTGLITWKDDQQDIGTMLPDGIYTIKETKAPDAYTLEGDNWTLTIEDGVPIIEINGNDVESDKAGAVDIFYLENDALYDLPSAGGPGIFLYMIGGTLLLMAGSLMIYINRRRGVLKR